MKPPRALNARSVWLQSVGLKRYVEKLWSTLLLKTETSHRFNSRWSRLTQENCVLTTLWCHGWEPLVMWWGYNAMPGSCCMLLEPISWLISLCSVKTEKPHIPVYLNSLRVGIFSGFTVERDSVSQLNLTLHPQGKCEQCMWHCDLRIQHSFPKWSVFVGTPDQPCYKFNINDSNNILSTCKRKQWWQELKQVIVTYSSKAAKIQSCSDHSLSCTCSDGRPPAWEMAEHFRGGCHFEGAI